MMEKIENKNQMVLDAAIDLAEQEGLDGVKRRAIADITGLSLGSVSNSFGTLDALRDAVIVALIHRGGRTPGALRAIAAALVDRHPAAVNAPDDVKQRALAALAA